MTQAEPVLLSFKPSVIAEMVLQLDDALDELEVVDAGTDLADYAARRFWHAHANLEGVRNTLAEWLGPLEDARSPGGSNDAASGRERS